MKSKFYKHTLTLEFLSEEPFTDDLTLDALIYEATHGSLSMRCFNEKDAVLTGKQAAKALMRQGSDPGFFGLTEAGQEII